MKPIRVLVVDDEEEFVQALVERLKLRGFDATGFTSGKNALEHMAKEAFDVALIDVRMPGFGGLDVVADMKRRWPNRKVILLTGHGSAEDAERGLRLGALHYLMKPVKIEQLVELLKQACGERSSP